MGGGAVTATGWAGRRVFVTGATGLVGSWLVRALLERGSDVTVLVRDADPQSELLRSGDIARTSVVNGAVEDLSVVGRALNHHRPDTVFHLAAQTQVRCAYRDPYETFESNVRGTYTLLEACRRHADWVHGIVVASSDKAYGDAATLPYTEATPLDARFPYDTSKLCTDVIARSYFATYRLPIAIARCGNIYGGGDLNWDRIVPGTIRSLLKRERPIIRSDGTLVRDYVYVKEVVEAYLTLAEHVRRPEVTGEAFNFSAGRPLSVLEVVEAIGKTMKVEPRPDVRGEAVAEIARQYLSSERARAVLGWSSRYALDQGLGETVEWYREFIAANGAHGGAA
ncbi:MAG: GDP-mannose 4,6-dehydratase [Candidatus Eisenbacteria bacterium]|uniref:GDP-mannose 4,6-dehydratase n=1 Tax=Eiseniibacteriota bacterium TaxID=2212470 RepID=A0A9D6L7I5_UNCEI|nr:GDP-mannose 4,6-dehydratase [Candidatus Eisenbacteria bacterium]MBI3540358.1 GDP-mannose 4,6-dehydratase [Candidatus Eisenbacteria bacterium]